MLRRSSSRYGLLLALAGALLLASCSRPGTAERPNFIFVLVDTLRADHLGVYGYARDTSRNVDAFARESLLFASSRSQSSSTFPSVNSILTSRSPTLFLGQPGQALGIPAEIPSIAEILRRNGYRTAAISGSPIVRNTPHRLNPTAGFGRGFDTFEEECLWDPAACLNGRALKHLRGEDNRPFFLYLHYIDPHDPYRPPRSERGSFRFARPRAASEKKFIRQGEPTPIAAMIYGGQPDPGVTPAELQHLIDLYDEEIAYFDRRFAEFLAAVREAGLLDNTILVFTSDHGEDFLEHGHILHGRTLFDTSIQTPLILRIPGVKPRVVTEPVQNLDIVPTLLDYAGIDTAGFQFEGRSLRALIEGREDGPRQQFAAQVAFRSASDDRFKLIHDLREGKFWLYDVAADPRETTDVLARERRSFHHLRETLTAWLARTEGEGTSAESVRKGDEAEARLKALGYLQ